MRVDDHLGHLVPPGRVRRPQLEQGLRLALERSPAATRLVVTLNPSDRAWLDPYLEDDLARALRAHVSIEFEANDAVPPGVPQFWAGTGDVLVLAGEPARVRHLHAVR
jgi:hypothetical protein